MGIEKWQVGSAFLLFSMMALLMFACNPLQEVVLSMDANGGKVELEAGQILVVKLDSNPTTGYRWEVAASDSSILETMGEAEYNRTDTGGTPLVGSGGTETFRFKAIGQGQSPLEMVYRRPWEEGVEPAGTFSLTIIVTGK